MNASILPLLFLSGIFIPIGDDAPAWITAVSNIFPVRHFFEAMANAFLGNAVPFAVGATVLVRGDSPWGVRSRAGPGGQVLQLGTAHVAAASAALVGEPLC